MPKRFADKDYFGARGECVEHAGAVGTIVARDTGRDAVWCEFNGERVLFTRRQDDAFRAFPGPADAPGLAIHFATV